MSPRVLPAANIISPQDSAGVDNFIDAIAAAFRTVALTTGLICEKGAIPPPDPSPSIDEKRRRQHFESQIRDLVRDGAILVEAGNWSAVAMWEPPGFQSSPPRESSGTVGPLRASWEEMVGTAKEKHIGGLTRKPFGRSRTPGGVAVESQPQVNPFYHLEFLGRNPDVPNVPGAISAVMLPFLERARNEGVPVWLEAATPRSVTVYEHLGFRMLEKMVVGIGRTNADGWPEDGGCGIPGWAMIYDAHLCDLR